MRGAYVRDVHHPSPFHPLRSPSPPLLRNDRNLLERDKLHAEIERLTSLYDSSLVQVRGLQSSLVESEASAAAPQAALANMQSQRDMYMKQAEDLQVKLSEQIDSVASSSQELRAERIRLKNELAESQAELNAAREKVRRIAASTGSARAFSAGPNSPIRSPSHPPLILRS